LANLTGEEQAAIAAAQRKPIDEGQVPLAPRCKRLKSALAKLARRPLESYDRR
jgi:hypothetical protein